MPEDNGGKIYGLTFIGHSNGMTGLVFPMSFKFQFSIKDQYMLQLYS